jgi:hypothetical protein
MRRTRMAGLWITAALGLTLAGGCPWFQQPPTEEGEPGAVEEPGGGEVPPGDGGGETGEPPGGEEVVTVPPPAPAKSIGFEVIAVHDPASGRYDANCIGCHGERTNEVALDGVTPAAHSTMQFGFLGTGNERCVSCHKSAPDFLSYSAGGLRELVNVERDLALESSCTSCHSSGNLAFYVRGF